MGELPFFAVHGSKVGLALLALAVALGLWRYRREPARKASLRRNEIAYPAPATLSEVSKGEWIAIEGRLWAEGELDLGDGAQAGIACAVAGPGAPRERRHTRGARALALDVGERRVYLEGPLDLRAGSREHYAGVVFGRQRWEAFERLCAGDETTAGAAVRADADGVGEAEDGAEDEASAANGDRYGMGATAILELRAGDRACAYGKVFPVATRRESGYRESESDWCMRGEEGAEVAVWHPDPPRATGASLGGGIWRALWVGAVALASIYGVANCADQSAPIEDDPELSKRLAALTSLVPWKQDSARLHYQRAFEALEPTRDRGRTLAGLYELRGRCERGAQELLRRQDLEGAAALADRCAGERAEEIALAATLLRGDVEGALSRADERGPGEAKETLGLLLRAGRWEKAWDALTDADLEKQLATCLDGWLAEEIGETPRAEPSWTVSHDCMRLRADRLEGERRIEFLVEHARASAGALERLLALEAALVEGEESLPAEVYEVYEFGNLEHRARELTSWMNDFVSGRPGSWWLDGMFPLYLAISERAPEDAEAFGDFVPVYGGRALFEALEKDVDEARAFADRASRALDRFAARIEARTEADGPDERESARDLARAGFATGGKAAARRKLRAVEDFIAFWAGEPDAVDEFAGRPPNLANLKNARADCAGGRAPSFQSGEVGEVLGRACGADASGLIDELGDSLSASHYDWRAARRDLTAIAPILGDQPELAEALSAAPMLPGGPFPTTIPDAHGLATQLWLIYDALGHQELSERWRERSLALRELLFSRDSAIVLSVL